jgi:hypothetical protein
MKKIKLWKNRNELSDKAAIIDDEDYEKVVEAVGRGKWYAHIPAGTKHYALNGNRDKSMHRVVMDAPKGMDVDHINGNPLDNRKSNLRICTRAQNCQNKKLRRDSASGFKGVYNIGKRRTKYTSKKTGETKYYEYELKKQWHAYIGDPNTAYPNKRHIRLGYYSTAEEAAMAYDKKAIELYGEFAYTNFPINNSK